MMKSVEAVCSKSCYMWPDKTHFRHRRRQTGTAMLQIFIQDLLRESGETADTAGHMLIPFILKMFDSDA